MFKTKQEYIESQKAKEQEAREKGYSDEEIRLAYKHQREIMKVSYLSDRALMLAREQINKINK